MARSVNGLVIVSNHKSQTYDKYHAEYFITFASLLTLLTDVLLLSQDTREDARYFQNHQYHAKYSSLSPHFSIYSRIYLYSSVMILGRTPGISRTMNAALITYHFRPVSTFNCGHALLYVPSWRTPEVLIVRAYLLVVGFFHQLD